MMKNEILLNTKSSSRVTSPRAINARATFIKTEFDILKNAPEKLHLLWKSIRKTDLITGGSPNISIFREIFEENKDIVKLYFPSHI